MIVVGLMSGTSADGIDAAVVDIEGAPPHLDARIRAYVEIPWDPATRDRIFELFRPETSSVDRICRMNFHLAEHFAEAALQAIAEAELAPADVHLIGSHGQTIYHDVGEDGSVHSTLQIGEAAVIARRTGVTTIANFRAADVAAGGQGAPLVSYADALLFRHPSLTRAVQNIGGIANVTFLPPLGDPTPIIAFDTGPGNVLINDAAERITDGAWTYDHDGELAEQGEVDGTLLAELMEHPFLSQEPPKTTGREIFGVQFGAKAWARGQAMGLRGEDIIATLTAFTADAIADAYRRFAPWPVEQVILGGGGSYNPTLVRMLRERLTPADVLRHEDLGLPSAAKEAVAFALMAYETWHNRPGNLPSCTGAVTPTVLGHIAPGNNYETLLKETWNELVD